MDRKSKVKLHVSEKVPNPKLENTYMIIPVPPPLKILSHLNQIDSNIPNSPTNQTNLLTSQESESTVETTLTRTKRKYERKTFNEYKCTDCDFITNSVNFLIILIRLLVQIVFKFHHSENDIKQAYDGMCSEAVLVCPLREKVS